GIPPISRPGATLNAVTTHSTRKPLTGSLVLPRREQAAAPLPANQLLPLLPSSSCFGQYDFAEIVANWAAPLVVSAGLFALRSLRSCRPHTPREINPHTDLPALIAWPGS